MRRGLLFLLASLALASCGSSTTTTITSAAPTPVTSTTTAASPTTNSASPTTTSSGSGTPAGAVFFEGADGSPAQRPSSLQLTGDGTLAVQGVQWTSWGGTEATGSGNAEYHGCTPNCAAAQTHTALVSVRLSGIRVCSGRSYYSGVTLTLNSGQLLDRGFLQRSWSPC